MKLIIGLGNPGPKYLFTRHNIGFLIVDKIKDHYSGKDFSMNTKFEGELSEISIDSEKVLLLKPMTYMNLSGSSVSKVSNFYKIPVKDILVVQDDIDLDTAKLRIRVGGSNGGHNGIGDMIKKLGTDQFYRLKIGVGRPEHKSQVAHYLTDEDFRKEELDLIYDKFDSIIKTVEQFVKGTLVI